MSNVYIDNFPKLETSAKMREPKVYGLLSKLSTSEYYGLCTGQIKALISKNEAIKYLTFLAMQNDKNKSKLQKVSETASFEEVSAQNSV